VGKRKLRAASRVAAEVERKMLAGLDEAQQGTLHDCLASCIDSLADDPDSVAALRQHGPPLPNVTPNSLRRTYISSSSKP
jgi:hypothetical protein